MAQQMTIQNLSDVTKKVYADGKIEVLLPFSVREVDVLAASKFLSTFPGDVIRFSASKLPSPEPGEGIVWVANVTGSPFVPKEVTLKRIEKGQEVEYKVPNPLAKAQVATSMMGVGQVWRANARTGEEECLNLPKVRIALAPFQRARVGRTVADWLLRRDGAQEKHHVGKVVVCREPSQFEPDESWSLDDIRVYADYVDSATFVRDHPVYGDVLGPPKSEFQDAQSEADAKVELLHKLFFRIIDPKYPLVPNAEAMTTARQLFRGIQANLAAKKPFDKNKLAALAAG